jgi:hypothetical protein
MKTKELFEKYFKLKNEPTEVEIDGKFYEDITLKKKKKEELKLMEDKIYELGVDYINFNHRINTEYLNNEEYYEYSSERGHLTLKSISDDCLKFNYTDSWAYGGYCDEWYYIDIKDIIKLNKKNTEQKFINERIKRINDELKGVEEKRIKLEEEKNKLQKK